MNKPMFTIPPIQWDGNKTVNTFNTYRIINKDNVHICNYAEGKFKEFVTIADLKDWVENVHYPAQIAKFMERV